MGTHYKGSEYEVRALNTFIKFTRAAESLNLWHNGVMAEYGLTISQFGTLEVLYHLGSMCQQDIAGKILKTPGNLTMVINNLEKRGLVSKEQDENDRRQRIISLTDKGQALIAGVFPGHVEKISDYLSVLSEKELETLAKLCKKLGTADREEKTE